MDDTHVLMDKGHMMGIRSPTDALMNVVNIVDVVDDVKVDGADG